MEHKHRIMLSAFIVLCISLYAMLIVHYKHEENLAAINKLCPEAPPPAPPVPDVKKKLK